MSSDNVLPSAPKDTRSDTQTQTLYPVLPDNNSNFRLKQISDIEKELKQQASLYRQVAKKYKKAHLATHWAALSLGATAAALSSAAMASA